MSDADIYRDTQSQYILIDGMRVHFKREGQGPVIVMLHGSGSSLHCFDEVVSRLIDEYEVIRLDLPGFGFTGPHPRQDYSVESYVSFLQSFLSALSVEKLSVCGNSFGGNIAWNFALDYPQKLDALVLMNATGYPGKSVPAIMQLARIRVGRALIESSFTRSAVKENLRKSIGSRMPMVKDSLVDRVFTLSNLPGNIQAFIEFSATEQPDRSSDIPMIEAPTLVLRGDTIDGQHFVEDIRNSREVIYPGVGHLLPDEAAADVAFAILQHLGAK